MTLPSDAVRAGVAIALPPAATFELFTRDIDLWWRRGPRFRSLGGERALIAIEPRVGGRVFESRGDADMPAHAIGDVLVWAPPERLVFTWRVSNFAPGESTEVDVRFEPRRDGSSTWVSVTHRGWAAIRGDHPVRHGRDSAAFLRAHAAWWGDLLTSLRLRS